MAGYTHDRSDSLSLETSRVVLLGLRPSVTPLACNAEDSICRGNMSRGKIVLGGDQGRGGQERGRRSHEFLRFIRAICLYN